jgi:hypothetical protein
VRVASSNLVAARFMQQVEALDRSMRRLARSVFLSITVHHLSITTG